MSLADMRNIYCRSVGSPKRPCVVWYGVVWCGVEHQSDAPLELKLSSDVDDGWLLAVLPFPTKRKTRSCPVGAWGDASLSKPQPSKFKSQSTKLGAQNITSSIARSSFLLFLFLLHNYTSDC